jgi:hypothetical protein
MLIPMEIPPALINRGAGRRRRSRKCFVAARLREKVGRTATKRLLLFQRDFHASNAKVQAGTFGVRGDLYNNTFGIFEVPYSAASNQGGTGRGSRIGACKIIHIVELVNFRGYNVLTTAKVKPEAENG